MLRALPLLLVLALEVYCLIDAITADDARVRHLPKVAWLLLILLFPLVGCVAWLIAGRPQGAATASSRWERSAPSFPEYDRPGRAAGVTAESDEDFLRRVRERAEEQRRRAAEQRRAQQARESDEQPPA